MTSRIIDCLQEYVPKQAITDEIGTKDYTRLASNFEMFESFSTTNHDPSLPDFIDLSCNILTNQIKELKKLKVFSLSNQYYDLIRIGDNEDDNNDNGSGYSIVLGNTNFSSSSIGIETGKCKRGNYTGSKIIISKFGVGRCKGVPDDAGLEIDGYHLPLNLINKILPCFDRVSKESREDSLLKYAENNDKRDYYDNIFKNMVLRGFKERGDYWENLDHDKLYLIDHKSSELEIIGNSIGFFSDTYLDLNVRISRPGQRFKFLRKKL